MSFLEQILCRLDASFIDNPGCRQRYGQVKRPVVEMIFDRIMNKSA
jgi:hypothetical protein